MASTDPLVLAMRPFNKNWAAVEFAVVDKEDACQIYAIKYGKCRMIIQGRTRETIAVSIALRLKVYLDSLSRDEKIRDL